MCHPRRTPRRVWKPIRRSVPMQCPMRVGILLPRRNFIRLCFAIMLHGSRNPLNQQHSKSSHSITSSARASICTGTVRPSAFAVFRLMIRSSLVAD